MYKRQVLVLPVPELCRCYSPLKTLRVQCLAQAPETTDIYLAGAEFKEFEPRLKHGWFQLNLYECFETLAGAQLEPFFGGSPTRFKFFKFGLRIKNGFIRFIRTQLQEAEREGKKLQLGNHYASLIEIYVHSVGKEGYMYYFFGYTRNPSAIIK